MERSELEAQIKKFKSRRLKARLANYGTFISIFLTLSTFARGFTSASLVSFLLIFPLPIYFGLQSIKLTRKSRAIKEHLSTLESSVSLLESKFSFGKFLSQPNLAFRLSCILFFVVLFTTFARLRLSAQTGTPDPTLSYQTHAVSRTP